MSGDGVAVADERLGALLTDEEREVAAVLTLGEAATILRMPISTASKLAREGTFPGVLPRLGGHGKWLVSKRVLFEYLRSPTTAPVN